MSSVSENNEKILAFVLTIRISRSYWVENSCCVVVGMDIRDLYGCTLNCSLPLTEKLLMDAEPKSYWPAKCSPLTLSLSPPPPHLRVGLGWVKLSGLIGQQCHETGLDCSIFSCLAIVLPLFHLSLHFISLRIFGV